MTTTHFVIFFFVAILFGATKYFQGRRIGYKFKYQPPKNSVTEPSRKNVLMVGRVHVDFDEIFNAMSSANEVREWVNLNSNKWGFFDEWPRGGGQHIMISAMEQCRYGKELEHDIKSIQDAWHAGVQPWLPLI